MSPTFKIYDFLVLVIGAVVLAPSIEFVKAFAPRLCRTGSATSLRRLGTESSTTSLAMSGDGIATGYAWHEEAFELEITVNVTSDVKAKDVLFKATPTSVDLRLRAGATAESQEELVLLDGTRKLFGRVNLDGTFWVIGDPEEARGQYRQVTVTIEKQIRTPKDDFDVIEYDWKGVYAEEDTDEVAYRRYDEPEELDVREYAASLGVDIDNINMDLVDKSMFTSGLNVTKSSFDTLKEAGLMKEVTEQSDGSEWTTDEEGGRVPFQSMGSGVSTAEKQAARSAPKTKIPFIDTDSPWNRESPKETQVSTSDALERDTSLGGKTTDSDPNV